MGTLSDRRLNRIWDPESQKNYFHDSIKLLAELPACSVAINTNTISIACERGFEYSVSSARNIQGISPFKIDGSIGHVIALRARGYDNLLGKMVQMCFTFWTTIFKVTGSVLWQVSLLQKSKDCVKLWCARRTLPHRWLSLCHPLCT